MLDTNIFVSGLISPAGPPGQIVDHWRDDRFTLIVSQAALDELNEVIRRPEVRRYFRRSPEWIDESMAELRYYALFVEPAFVDVVPEDPPDNLILGTAVGGAADYLVSGNDHLLNLGPFHGIEIVAPRRFLYILDRSM